MSEDCGQYVASKDITLGVVFPHVLVAGHLGLRRKERERDGFVSGGWTKAMNLRQGQKGYRRPQQ